MKVTISEASARAAARALKAKIDADTQSARKGNGISHVSVLHAIAVASGYETWNAMQAAFASPTTIVDDHTAAAPPVVPPHGDIDTTLSTARDFIGDHVPAWWLRAECKPARTINPDSRIITLYGRGLIAGVYRRRLFRSGQDVRSFADGHQVDVTFRDIVTTGIIGSVPSYRDEMRLIADAGPVVRLIEGACDAVRRMCGKWLRVRMEGCFLVFNYHVALTEYSFTFSGPAPIAELTGGRVHRNMYWIDRSQDNGFIRDSSVDLQSALPTMSIETAQKISDIILGMGAAILNGVGTDGIPDCSSLRALRAP